MFLDLNEINTLIDALSFAKEYYRASGWQQKESFTDFTNIQHRLIDKRNQWVDHCIVEQDVPAYVLGTLKEVTELNNTPW